MRKREIGYGWVMGDEIGQAAAGFMRRDLGGTISAARSQRCDLAGVFGVGVVVQWLVCSSTLSSCSLSFSLRVFEFGNHLKVKQKHK